MTPKPRTTPTHILLANFPPSLATGVRTLLTSHLGDVEVIALDPESDGETESSGGLLVVRDADGIDQRWLRDALRRLEPRCVLLLARSMRTVSRLARLQPVPVFARENPITPPDLVSALRCLGVFEFRPGPVEVLPPP